MCRYLLPGFIVGLVALWACSSKTPRESPVHEPLQDGGSDSPSDAPDATTLPREDSSADATPDDGVMADTSLADALVGDASSDDATLMDSTFCDAASDDDTPRDDGPLADSYSADALLDAASDVIPRDVTVDGPPGADDARSWNDAGDAPSDAAAEAFMVTPTMTSGRDIFALGDLSFEVDPQVGGRIVSFALGGQNVLMGLAASPINYGSTFWTSPQSDWNWPPPSEIDNQAYAASVDGGKLTLQGMQNGALGVAITKVFSMDALSGSVSIDYTIRNVGTSARSLAPWEVTRVRSSGLIFFPTGQQAHSADSGPSLPTQQGSGATWFDAGSASVTTSIKFFADGTRGWIAQESGGLVFVKKFKAIPLGSQAPGEAEIEIYVSGNPAYVELEEQGMYQPIAAGASSSWTTRWILVKLPASVDGSVGSASLVAFVDAL